jgi:hypothetical protein
LKTRGAGGRFLSAQSVHRNRATCTPAPAVLPYGM